jgi:5-oxoprolinase (ATP-hydrolysing)/N-methylhydantoinase B
MAGELFLSDGTRLAPKGRYDLLPGQTVTLRLPGGGGYGPSFERDPAAVLDDVLQARVSVDSAREQYGVVIDTQTWTVDEEATVALRNRK